MSFSISLVLGGSLIYALASSDTGALMIAAGCAIEAMRLADRVAKHMFVKR